MVGVQMGAHDIVDLFGPDAGCGEFVEPVMVALVEAGKVGTVLVVAAAAIDQDHMAAGLDQIGADGGTKLAGVRVVVKRFHPVHMPGERVRVAVRQQLLRHEARLHALFDINDGRFADTYHSNINSVALSCGGGHRDGRWLRHLRGGSNLRSAQ